MMSSLHDDASETNWPNSKEFVWQLAVHQPVREGSATQSTHQPATLSVIPKLFDSLLGAVVSIMDANVLVREAARMRNK